MAFCGQSYLCCAFDIKHSIILKTPVNMADLSRQLAYPFGNSVAAGQVKDRAGHAASAIEDYAASESGEANCSSEHISRSKQLNPFIAAKLADAVGKGQWTLGFSWVIPFTLSLRCSYYVVPAFSTAASTHNGSSLYEAWIALLCSDLAQNMHMTAAASCVVWYDNVLLVSYRQG